MTDYPHPVPKLLVAAVAVLRLPGRRPLAVSQSPPKPVVGAGTIEVPSCSCATAPSGDARPCSPS